MTRKSAIYALAVAVLMGTMAVAASAEDHGMNMYGGFGSVLSADRDRSDANQTAYGGFGSALTADSEMNAAQQATPGGFGSVLSADLEKGTAQQDKGEIREPMETGAVPQGHDGSSNFKGDTGE